MDAATSSTAALYCAEEFTKEQKKERKSPNKSDLCL